MLINNNNDVNLEGADICSKSIIKENGFPVIEFVLENNDDVCCCELVSPNFVISEIEKNDKVDSDCVEKVCFSEVVSTNVICKCVEVVSRLGLFSKDTFIFNPSNCDCEIQTCDVCKKGGLLKIAKDFTHRNSNLTKNLSKCSNDEIKRFSTDIEKIIRSLRRIELRECDIVNAIIIFKSVVKRHSQCSTFVILRNDLRMVFLAGLIIAHKLSVDITYRNGVFVEELRRNNLIVSLECVNEWERRVLCMMEWDLRECTDRDRYNSEAGLLGGSRITNED
jgi:hypothetical protein